MSVALPLPKYHQVYLVLKERLIEGVYDRKLTSEAELTEEFGVSRVTIRKALSPLAQEGLIERVAGRGTRRMGGAPPALPGRRPGALSRNVVGGPAHFRHIRPGRVALLRLAAGRGSCTARR